MPEEMLFKSGESVRITGGYYEGRVGTIVDSDERRDTDMERNPIKTTVYQVEGKGIDPNSAEQWVEWYNLERL
ncbi:MAG: hypothetical protein QCI38_07715 [Candidatus Thermoplasmatota archaeon]|nr:hypothetical protein [Candidatus Thermoplasmatota archaeon]